MPRIHIILEDDEGNPLPDAARRTYRLEGDLDTLDGIERAVEGFKQRALPEIERSLLSEAQKGFVASARGGKTTITNCVSTAPSAFASRPFTVASSSKSSGFCCPTALAAATSSGRGKGWSVRSSESFACTSRAASASPRLPGSSSGLQESDWPVSSECLPLLGGRRRSVGGASRHRGSGGCLRRLLRGSVGHE